MFIWAELLLIVSVHHVCKFRCQRVYDSANLNGSQDEGTPNCLQRYSICMGYRLYSVAWCGKL